MAKINWMIPISSLRKYYEINLRDWADRIARYIQNYFRELESGG